MTAKVQKSRNQQEGCTLEPTKEEEEVRRRTQYSEIGLTHKANLEGRLYV